MVDARRTRVLTLTFALPLAGYGICRLSSIRRRRTRMAKDHGSSVKNDKQYEGLRKKGMSKSRAAAISNSPGSSSRGGKKSGSSSSNTRSSPSQGGTTQQKKAAGRKGGQAAAGKS